MAKPKFPRKSNDPAVASTTTQPTVTDANPAPTQTVSAAIPATEPRKTEIKKPARKPEIVRSEPRASVVPINLEDEIRRLAYLLAERRGFEPGHEAEDWLTAEHEVRQRYHQQSA